ncbi:MAG: hypothetical protein ACXWNK_18005 [Vulcanimicrobiaceae bacterium]
MRSSRSCNAGDLIGIWSHDIDPGKAAEKVGLNDQTRAEQRNTLHSALLNARADGVQEIDDW